MAKKKENDNIRRVINWVLAMVALVLIVYVAFKGYNIYKDNLLDKSVLDRTIGTISLDDASKTKVELPSYAFIIVSYTNSSENRRVEKELKDLILKYNLQDYFYYLDATDLTLEDNYIDKINSKLKLSNDNKITNLPAIIYYKNEKNVKTINKDNNGTFGLEKFKNLLISEQIIEK